ncbi:MAG: lactonase family protein [Pedosphaera sp.]|nr:lactonase family protein [Pedosphaera sp.]
MHLLLSRRDFANTLLVSTASLGIAGCETVFQHPLPKTSATQRYRMYVGTYTGPKSQGIHGFNLNSHTGSVEFFGLVASAKNPTFLAVHPTGKYLYAANETAEWNGARGGYVSAYRIDASSGHLSLLNEQSSVGDGPCHLSVDHTGRCLLVANYGGGSVTVLPLNADGSLRPHSAFVQHAGASINPGRQKEPHAHSFNVSPDNRFAFAADLGLDRIVVYRLAANDGRITPNDPPFSALTPGSGPRHFAFHPNGASAFVINELKCTLTAFRYNAARGVLTETQTISTLPPGEAMRPEFSTAEVAVHPGGGFVYGSNRGHDSIVVFAIEPGTGLLRWVQNESTQGKTPRNFAIDPSGRWLFAENQGSDSIVQYRIDSSTGRLASTGKRWDVGAPVCIRFVAA